MAARVERWAWPPGITEDMLPDIYDGWATPLRMHAGDGSSSSSAPSSSKAPLTDDDSESSDSD